jgi:putative membrane protein
MKRMFVAAVLATVLGIVQASTAAAQGTMPAVDWQFMLDAVQGGAAEVELGRLAAQRAASDAVRQFGQRMATDHGAANTELMQLAQRKGVVLPRDIDAAHRATISRLSAMSGPAFDQAYMAEMMRDHQQDATLFTREANQGQDPEVRAWAAKILPTIQEHQRFAADVHSRTAQVPAVPPVVVAQPPVVVPQPSAVAVVPAPAASPATTTVITTTVTPLPPFCGGAYRPDVGTNFGGCPAP